MASVFLIFGTLLALNLSFTGWLAEGRSNAPQKEGVVDISMVEHVEFEPASIASATETTSVFSRTVE